MSACMCTLQELKEVELLHQEFHEECRTNTETEASKIWEQTEAFWNLPVLQQKSHPFNLPVLIWRVPGLPQILPNGTEVPNQDRLLMREGSESVLAMVRTHAASSYTSKGQSLIRRGGQQHH